MFKETQAWISAAAARHNSLSCHAELLARRNTAIIGGSGARCSKARQNAVKVTTDFASTVKEAETFRGHTE